MSKILINILLFLGILISPLAEAQSCTASFKYEILDDISSYTYRFINQSVATKPIISYSWSFGDGIGSKLTNPEHQYLDQGIYEVSLTILDADSCTDSFSQTIVVEKVALPTCMSFFTFIYNSVSPNYTYFFSDHSVSGTNDTINSWTWDFGDGTNSSYQNPVHQFQSTGNFIVSLVITTKLGCQSSYSFTVVVNPGGVACQASFSSNQDTISNPLKFYFHDNSIHSTNITSWKWYFDDGDSSALQDPTHTFLYAGIYFVRLKITTQGGCSSEVNYPINVNNPQPYNLWGRVYAWPYVIDKCIAYLYKEYSNNYYKPIDTVRLTSVNDTLGVYYFFQIPEGKHKVKVLLPGSSQFSENYAPTYFGDDEKWLQGSTINLFQDIAMANVNLKPTTKQIGNCQVSGQVLSTNIYLPQPSDIELLLYNTQGQIVDYVFTNPTGDFEFNDLALGQYFIVGEVTGLNSQHININFQSNSDTISNLVINLDNKNITGFLLNELNHNIKFEVFPNPVQNLLKVSFEKQPLNQLIFEVFDLQGRKIIELKNEVASSYSIPVDGLKQGIYFLKISSSDITFSSQIKFIKN